VADVHVDACALTTGAIWPETGVAAEVRGRVVSTGKTEAAGQLAEVRGRACTASAAIAWPTSQASLTCANASYVGESGGGDEYAAQVTFTLDVWRFVYQFSGDGGATWTTCDANGIAASPVVPGTASVLITNGGLERWSGQPEKPDGYSDAGGVVVERSMAEHHGGGASAKLTRNSTNNALVEIMGARQSVVAGRGYTVSIWFLDNNANAKTNVIVAWYDASDVLVGSVSYGGTYTGDQTGWQEIARQMTAPTGAAYVRIGTRVYSQTGGTSTGGFVYLDDVSLTAN